MIFILSPIYYLALCTVYVGIIVGEFIREELSVGLIVPRLIPLIPMMMQMKTSNLRYSGVKSAALTKVFKSTKLPLLSFNK